MPSDSAASGNDRTANNAVSTCDCAEHPMAPHLLGEPPCVHAPKCPTCFSVHCDGCTAEQVKRVAPSRTLSNDDLIAAYKQAVVRRDALRRELDLTQIDVNDLYLEVVKRAEAVQERAHAERTRDA